jgi:TP901 family phage tail tape measure protein
VGDIATILVALGINTGPFTAGMAKAKGELTGFAAEADRSGKRASSSMNGIGIASLAVVGGVAAIGVSAIKSASDFQASMALVQTQAGASAAEVTKMTGAVLSLAPTVGIGPDQLAAGLYHVESAGIRGAKALDVLTIAAEGAKVGNANLESVTNALIAEVNSGVGGVQNMSQAMGVLNAIVGAGNMRMDDLTAAFTTGVLSSAKVFGVSIQSVGAAIATMTNAGIPAIDAATKLNSAMRLMAAPSGKAAKELATIGLSSTQLAKDMRTPGGILTAVQDLQAHLTKAGLNASQQARLLANAFGGKQSLGVLTLIGSLDKLGGIQKQVTAGAGAFDAAWAATKATTKEQGAQVEASISTVKDAIGIGLLPAVNNLLHSVLPMVQGLAMWAAANPELASQVLLVTGGVAALVAGLAFLPAILHRITGAIGIITSPILLVTGAVLALAAHFGLLGKGAQDAVDGIAAKIAGAFPMLKPVFDAIGTAVGLVGKAFDYLFGVIQPAEGEMNNIGYVVKATQSRFSDFIDVLRDIGARGLPAVIAFLPSVVSAFGHLADMVAGVIRGIIARLSELAGAFVGWIGPMIPQAIAALQQFAASAIAWIGQQVPVVLAALGQWAQAFVAWVSPMIPPVLASLGQLAGQVLDWIGAQAPAWVAQLSKWGSAFLGWIMPIAGKAVAMLGDFAGKVVAWVKLQIPIWTTQLLKWAQAFVAWVSPMIPKLLGALGDLGKKAIGAMVEFAKSAVAWAVNDFAPKLGDALASAAQMLVDWIAPMIGPAINALLSFMGSLGTWLINNAGTIAAGAVAIGLTLITGIAGYVGSHPEVIVAAIALWLGAQVVMGAVSVAAAAAGRAYGAAMGAATKLGQVLSAVWGLVTTIVAEIAGHAAGVGYSIALKIGQTIGAVLSGVWGLITTVAAWAAGLLAGAAYAAAVKIGQTIEAGLSVIWSGLAAGPVGVAVAAAGAEAGLGFTAAFALVLPAALTAAVTVALAIVHDQVGKWWQTTFGGGTPGLFTPGGALGGGGGAPIRPPLPQPNSLDTYLPGQAPTPSAVIPTLPTGVRRGGVNAYALGGIVPGFGPQIAIVHGGETILPPDYMGTTGAGLPSRPSGGGNDRLAAALDRFSAALEKAAGGVPLTLDGQAVGDMVNKQLYTSRSIYSTLSPATGSAR